MGRGGGGGCQYHNDPADKGTRTMTLTLRELTERLLEKEETLRNHQTELEMQNEELKRVCLELDKMRDKYFDLYNLAPVGYVTIDGKGIILECNVAFATIAGCPVKRIPGNNLRGFIVASQANYQAYQDFLIALYKSASATANIIFAASNTYVVGNIINQEGKLIVVPRGTRLSDRGETE